MKFLVSGSAEASQVSILYTLPVPSRSKHEKKEEKKKKEGGGEGEETASVSLYSSKRQQVAQESEQC